MGLEWIGQPDSRSHAKNAKIVKAHRNGPGPAGAEGAGLVRRGGSRKRLRPGRLPGQAVVGGGGEKPGGLHLANQEGLHVFRASRQDIAVVIGAFRQQGQAGFRGAGLEGFEVNGDQG